MPSAIALLECREALAREELESWLEAVREAEEGEVATRRADSGPGTASVQDKVDDSPSVSVAGPAAVAAVPVIVGQAVPTGTGGGVDHDQRPPPWQAPASGEERTVSRRALYNAFKAHDAERASTA
ncbi:hypothetical protein ACIQV3_21265 [Streptomyces sp. NPDC099050]|uniref:hypothetical protein n=1 Tax=Streptomyces sp. NPDC099050 TaxID=3366100 RepID=UPI0038085DA0